MDCARIQREELLEKYLNGQLDRASREAVEAHVFACPTCFQEIEILTTLQSKLWKEACEAPVPSLPKEAPSRRFRLVPAAAAALLILAVGTVVLWKTGLLGRIGPRSRVTETSFAELIKIEPPAYVPSTSPRGSADEAGERFARGMDLYRQGRLAEAIPDLEAAVKLDPSASHGQFFLGICLLLTGRDGPAIDRLQKTVDLRDPVYSAEAHFFLAKGFLRQKDFRRARRELETVARSGGVLSREAGRLLKLLAG